MNLPSAPEAPPKLDPADQAMRARLLTNMFGDAPDPVRIGRYVVLERIGEGGLGRVYSVFDPKLDRRVALKLIRSAGESGQRLLIEEARAMARLHHTNVVTVHDVGHDEAGLYLAMELVDGEVLDRWTAHHRPNWRKLREVMLGVGQGLTAAHEAELIHCDLKPGNLMVDRTGQAKVLDFGLAKALAPRHADEDKPAIAGTPAYMAPEQLRGEALDPRCDQWSFCLTFYELLHGHRPFADRSDQLDPGDHAEALARPVGGEVPRFLHEAILRGLALRRDDRWPSMAALLAALTQDLRSKRRRNLGLAAAMLVSAILAASAVWLLPRPVPEATRQEIARLVAEAEAAAQRKCYVYPDPGSDQSSTAFGLVHALEATQGEGAELAQSAADRLRQEFSKSLLELAQRNWRNPVTRAFATDYYAHVLLFDPDNVEAKDRSTLSPGELHSLAEHSRDNNFTPGQRSAGATLNALAQSNEDERAEALRKLLRARHEAALSTTLRLSGLLPDDPASDRDDPATSPPKSSKGQPDEKPATTQREDPGIAAPRRNPIAAQRELRQAQKALRAGRSQGAERHFHRALSHDARSLAALSGLSELYFERAAYPRAVEFAEKALRVAPSSAKAHMALGHAYFKTLRYADAKRHYRRAQKLGHRDATRALKRLAKRLGDG